MIRINSFRNLALAIGFASGVIGCAAPTGNDSVGQSDDEVRHAHVVGVDGAGWDNGANGNAAGKGPMAMPLNSPGFARSPSPEPWRASPDDSPSPEPWNHLPPPSDDGSSGGSSSGENPHPNSMAPATK